jgi:hypothetical protein
VRGRLLAVAAREYRSVSTNGAPAVSAARTDCALTWKIGSAEEAVVRGQLHRGRLPRRKTQFACVITAALGADVIPEV